jgi:hypothetical protein
MRPGVIVTTLVIEIVWLAVAIAAFEAEIGSRLTSTPASIAVVALIWASPAIALCVMAWLIEQLLRVRDLGPPPPPPVAPPPPPQAA